MTSSVDPLRTASAVAGHLQRGLRSGRPDGLVLGVTTPDGDTVQGAGRTGAGGGTPDAATIFEIGSVTKLFTALALAVAAGRGEVRLDEPAADLLPEGVTVPSRDGRQITLADLATHSSGLPRLPAGMIGELLRHPGLRHDPYVAFGDQDLYASLPRTRLRGAPGRRVRYSNLGAGLLGHALAVRLGTSYEAMIRERICAPLGLRDTVVTLDADQQARFATGHTRRGTPTPPWEFAALAGCGALRSTAADLLVFLRAQLAASAEPGPGGELAAAMALTHTERAPMRRGTRVGLGWIHLLQRGRPPLLWHDGGTGGFRSLVAMDPAAGTAVVALTNASRNVDGLGFRLLRAVVEAGSG